METHPFCVLRREVGKFREAPEDAARLAGWLGCLREGGVASEARDRGAERRHLMVVRQIGQAGERRSLRSESTIECMHMKQNVCPHLPRATRWRLPSLLITAARIRPDNSATVLQWWGWQGASPDERDRVHDHVEADLRGKRCCQGKRTSTKQWVRAGL